MFRSRRQEARSRYARSAVAVVALLFALVVLVAWLATRYYLSGAADRPDSSDASSAPEDMLTADTSASLLILGDAGNEHFLLVQFAPAAARAYVAAIPASMDDGTGQAIAATLQKSGAPRVKLAVQESLQLSVSHYIVADTEGVEEYMNYLEGSLPFNLPEAVSYTDANGLTVHLDAGQRQLTAGQIGLLLRYTGWSSTTVRDTVSAGLITTILNQYMQPGHRFDGDFAALANVVQTDVRIDHYNAYRTTLQALADTNTGSLAQTVPIVGRAESGLFRPDLQAMRQQTALYDQPEGDNG